VLLRAWRLRPDDFWVNYDLARSRAPDAPGKPSEIYPQPEEAVGT
jgi:hypothetical protein